MPPKEKDKGDTTMDTTATAEDDVVELDDDDDDDNDESGKKKGDNGEKEVREWGRLSLVHTLSVSLLLAS